MQDHGHQRPVATLAADDSLPHSQRNGAFVARFSDTPSATAARDDHAPLGVMSLVRSAVLHDLSHQERLLVILWHVERMTPAEIGAVLDTTAERVLQMYDAVVSRLRSAVSKAA